MPALPRTTRRLPRAVGPAALAALLTMGLTLTPAAASSAASPEAKRPKPTIVLEHGAFADASGWNDVIHTLQRRGYTVYAPANPLRSLTGDTEYLKSFLATLSGPVVLVGHSYGGAVITGAATGNPAVKALVYIAAYAPEQGESVGQATALGGGSTELLQHIVARPFPGAATGDADASIDPAYFRQLFAQDLPAAQAAQMAAAQRPAAFATLAQPAGAPGWKTIPSWYLVARDDHTIPPAAERAMAKRAGARTVEINSSHAAMASHPRAVSDLILNAATS
ncbi:Pyrethroid hydrolase [Streptomyces sp. ADI95-16]|uniref:alpha/beta fold hydrolase n=1 Tax=Streptomyces sp. ADI95-16 TaxID=1522758 RepID=UPI000F3A96CE|nr:alpha/beta hydrolase [Streptomyces sp. ADI95-16]AYV32122.1 Pyrethroid hydrolase [Streptomyces sp. ADI95-16]